MGTGLTAIDLVARARYGITGFGELSDAAGGAEKILIAKETVDNYTNPDFLVKEGDRYSRSSTGQWVMDEATQKLFHVDQRSEADRSRTDSDWIGRELGMSKHTIYAWKGKFVIATVRAAAMSFGRQCRTGCGRVLTIVMITSTFTFSCDVCSVQGAGFQASAIAVDASGKYLHR